MNKLGFKNFRKFSSFEPISFNGITFLVGKNNAGKSTFVKALILILEYFKSNKLEKFPIGNLNNEEINIASFGRAKNNLDPNNDVIEFSFSIETYDVQLSISGSDDDREAKVYALIIEDKNSGLKFTFNPQKYCIQIAYSKMKPMDQVQITSRKESIKILQGVLKELMDELKLIDKKKEVDKYVEKKSKIANLKNGIKHLKDQFKDNLFEENFIVQSDDNDDWYSYPINQTINEFLKLQEDKCNNRNNYKELLNEDNQSRRNREKLIEQNESVQQSFNLFIETINNLSYKYLASFSQKQNSLLLIKDKQNALAQSVHEFYQKKIQVGEVPYEFVKKWMNKFDVGDDFEIIPYANEGYEVKIISNNIPYRLSDMGMGSVQAMLLIFRLAGIIDTQINIINYKSFIFIEEPELNLHPALQSMLADLFLEVHMKFDIDFLIETHSEYILRRSQVIVAEKDFEVEPNENPFYVHYFPNELDQVPYQLNYLPDGSFDRNFGTGFFDTASLDTFKLLRIRREKKA